MATRRSGATTATWTSRASAGSTCSISRWTSADTRSPSWRWSPATRSAAGTSCTCAATSRSRPRTPGSGRPGPKVGSFDGGYGIGLLARQIGEKRAKEVWFLCRQYDAETALGWGLVNAVVPVEDLEATTVAWCREMLRLLTARAPAAEGRLPRGRRRPGGRAAARRRRDAPVLHDRGGAGRPRTPSRRSATRTSRGSRSGRDRRGGTSGGAARGRGRSVPAPCRSIARHGRRRRR